PPGLAARPARRRPAVGAWPGRPVPRWATMGGRRWLMDAIAGLKRAQFLAARTLRSATPCSRRRSFDWALWSSRSPRAATTQAPGAEVVTAAEAAEAGPPARRLRSDRPRARRRRGRGRAAQAS